MGEIIPDDILDGARKYCEQQIAVMQKYGSCPKLTPKQRESLAERVARIILRARKAHRRTQ